ncbi:MAG TPA: ferritin-like domain-containing protein [Nitrospinota bacterium]|jgi:bacterioferritin|nr:ferritin-like domain-containing protein [Nitrospinota bacterium]|tara:strand:- start:1010 stop:1489 length:480 start_codon:yes stop_codon:yes gene_type:complete
MKGKKKKVSKVVKVLSEVYWAEIGAVGIYMDQHTKCSSMGYEKLAGMFKKDAIDEMKHAEQLVERILFLEGTVYNEKHMVPEETQKEVVDMLKQNIDIEIEAVDRLGVGISTCFTEGDHGSRLLLEEILKSEEAHLDKLKTFYENIQKYGDQFIVTHLM